MMAPGWKFVGRPLTAGLLAAAAAAAAVAYHREHCCLSARICLNADFRPASGRVELGVAIIVCLVLV